MKSLLITLTPGSSVVEALYDAVKFSRLSDNTIMKFDFNGMRITVCDVDFAREQDKIEELR